MPRWRPWWRKPGRDGGLRARTMAGDSTQESDFAYYRDNYVVALYSDGRPSAGRGNFVPGPDDRIAWFSYNGRLHARQD